MTIRRQYLLPNCNLIVEGLSRPDESPADRPLLAIAINVECHFQGRQQILSGGKAFIQNLTAAASAYAQECLSGLPRAQEPQTEEDRVQIQPREGRHCLIWQPGSKGQAQPVEIELSTMELFDLVEAIDQLAADRQTLPDLQVSLEPLHRRHRRPEEPLTQRAAPLAIGTAGLALAAATCFLIPAPEVREPQPTDSNAPGQVQPPAADELPLIPDGDALPLTPDGDRESAPTELPQSPSAFPPEPEGSSSPAETAPPSNEEALPETPEAAPDGNFENLLEDPLSPAPENEPLPDLSNP